MRVASLARTRLGVRLASGLALAGLAAACNAPLVPPESERLPAGLPLPPLPELAGLPEQIDGRPVLRVRDGRLPDLAGRLLVLRPGPASFLIVNEVPGLDVADAGIDLGKYSISLWIHGHGPARHWLPQASSGKVNGGVMQDWAVELPPGDYELEIRSGGSDRIPLRVR
jgi:hypothetical protein